MRPHHRGNWVHVHVSFTRIFLQFVLWGAVVTTVMHPFKVSANTALRFKPGLSECAALASFLAGILVPWGTPSFTVQRTWMLYSPLYPMFGHDYFLFPIM